MSDNVHHILQELKVLDYERYLACLYLDEKHRDAAATLYAFDAEISRIPDLVSEPIPGEIRIQWWRDLIKSGNNMGSGPLANSLMQVINTHNLPRETFDTFLDARIFDLYQDPMPDQGTFEGYLGETDCSILQMVALCAGIERSPELADACGHAGMATGLLRILSSTARHRSRQQLYLPLDLLAKHDLDRESWLVVETDERHASVIKEAATLAEDHIAKARKAIPKLPKEARNIFLPLAFASPLNKKIRKAGAECLAQPVALSPISRHWTAFKWVILGR